jgi:membrane fusion protein, multidrug efflux system
MNRASALLAMAIAVVLTGTFATGLQNANASSQSEQKPSVLVTLTKLQKGALPRVVTVFGTIETNAKTKQTVTAPVSAVVDAIYVKVGEAVAADTPLLRLGPSPETAAAYTKALSALHAAREMIQRTRELLSQHLATQQQLTAVEKSVADAKATLTALKAEGAGSLQTLRAPFQSVVTGVSITPGALVSKGTVLLSLARQDDLILYAGVVPEKAAEIHNGDLASVSPLGETTAVSGRVSLRSSMVDPKTGLVPIDITLPAGSYLPGQAAEARIVTGKIHGYVVPHAAILVNENGAPYVVQSPDMTAQKIPVKILLSAGAKDVISGPLNQEAPLVLAGNHQLDNGMKVRVADPNPVDSR